MPDACRHCASGVECTGKEGRGRCMHLLHASCSRRNRCCAELIPLLESVKLSVPRNRCFAAAAAAASRQNSLCRAAWARLHSAGAPPPPPQHPQTTPPYHPPPLQIPCDPKLLLPPYDKEEIAAFKLTEASGTLPGKTTEPLAAGRVGVLSPGLQEIVAQACLAASKATHGCDEWCEPSSATAAGCASCGIDRCHEIAPATQCWARSGLPNRLLP